MLPWTSLELGTIKDPITSLWTSLDLGTTKSKRSLDLRDLEAHKAAGGQTGPQKSVHSGPDRSTINL